MGYEAMLVVEVRMIGDVVFQSSMRNERQGPNIQEK